MKKIQNSFKFILFLSLTLSYISCDKESILTSVNSLQKNEDSQVSNTVQFAITEDTKEVKFKNLEGIIPAEYPSELFEFNANNLSDIALNKFEKKYQTVKGIKGSSLSEIIESVYKRYPSFETFDSKQYKKFFPKLSNDEILKNSEIILQFTEKLMAYEVVSAFSQLENTEFTLKDFRKPKNKNARGYISSFEWLNSVCTVAVVVTHLRLDISGLWNAVDVANNLSSSHGTPTTNGGTNDRQDALRHGIWGAFLGKYATWRYGDKNHATQVISELLIAHECGYGGMSVAMDMHNNCIALSYYYNHVIQTGPWWNRNTEIPQSDDDIVNEIKTYPVDFVTNSNQIDERNCSTLVRYE